jgi:predicted RND superfamily exporter protein
VVTLIAGSAGILGMIALCHLVGLKVNFLDLVALPITIGIGIDYSVNLAVRARQDGDNPAANLLGTTGGAVVLCSLTTIIGYGSLLLSENAGIRSFGLAAMLGELACLSAALLLVPGLLLWLRRRRATAR